MDSHPGLPTSRDEQAERERILRSHQDYESSSYYRRIWKNNPASMFILRRRWDLIDEVLRDTPIDRSRARVLDLGAGAGEGCIEFSRLGFDPGRIVGLDLNGAYLRRGREAHPWMLLVEGSATRLPFPDGAFDLVFQSTMLSSMLDETLRARVLSETRRALAPGGIFMSYDMRYPNPANRYTRPLRLPSIRKAFPGWRIDARSVTAIPHLLRLVAPLSSTACHVLEAIPFLRSHLLMVARKA